MFIDLTDHLRCPGDHPEQFLVLLPDRMDGRLVATGHLGCPICGLTWELADGTLDFKGGTPAAGPTGLSAEGAHALLGLEGPGGFVALFGRAASLAEGLSGLLPGVRFVLVNPESTTGDSETGSVVRSPRVPLKRSSMRGVVLGEDAAGDPRWVEEAIAAVLPGLRAVGAGPAAPALEGFEVMAVSAEGWVGRRGK